MPPDLRDPHGPPVRSLNPTMHVMSQAIPVFLACVIGYALYTVADFILMQQIFRRYHEHKLALGLLIPYAVTATAMVVCYLRTFVAIRTDPGVIPLGPDAARKTNAKDWGTDSVRRGRRPIRCYSKSCGFRRCASTGSYSNSTSKMPLHGSAQNGVAAGSDLESGLAYGMPYERGDTNGGAHFTHTPRSDGVGSNAIDLRPNPRLDPDSPGLELFYTKDVFECAPDGRPVWCSPCGTWKPDRTHHCSEIGRCVRKMDHFCPWVGGVVSETSYKFFVQFNFYATLVCGLAIVSCACGIQKDKQNGTSVDARIVVLLVFASVLGLFTSAMTLTCVRFAFGNLTSVETHQLRSRPKMMAVRIRRGSPPVDGKYNVVTYPLPKPEDPVASPGYQTMGGQPGERSAAETLQTLQTLSNDEHDLNDDEQDPIKAARAARAARRTARDQLACRTFAIVAVERGMNVWDLGWRQNWTAVMGTSLVDWLLPLRQSPCCDHEATMTTAHSFYPLSPAFKQLCARLDLPPCPEMEQLSSGALSWW